MDTGTSKPSEAPFALYVMLTIIFGVTNSLTGLVVPELESQANLTSAEIGGFFVYRGIGSMAGGLVSGYLLDAARNPHNILAVFVFVQACAKVGMPEGWNLTLVGLNVGLLAFCGNGIQTCAATSINWTYEKAVGRKNNISNAAFGLGGTLAPMLATALVSQGQRAMCGYIVLAGIDLLAIVAVCIIPARLNPAMDKPKEATPADTERNKPLLDDRTSAESGTTDVNWCAVALGSAGILFQGVCEASLLFWCFAFATGILGFADDNARGLNSLFWVAFTSARIMSIFLVGKLGKTEGDGAARICIGAILITLPSTLAMGVPISIAGNWLPAAALVIAGFGSAPLYANVVTVLRDVTFLNGKANGCVRITSSIGNMSGAACVGFASGFLGRLALPCVATTSIVVDMIVLALLLRLRSAKSNSAS